MTPETLALLEVQHLYARQSLAVDGGDAAGWAATFTDDGVFESPTYERPVTGAVALEDFARRLHESAPYLHHVVTNVCVDEVGDDHVEVRANLLIITTHDLASGAARIERITTIHDRLRRHPSLRLERRRVVRDGDGPTKQGAAHD